MSTLLPSAIDFYTPPVGTTVQAHAEMTRAPVVNNYDQAMNVFYMIANLGITPPLNADPELNRQQVITALTSGTITNPNSIYNGQTYAAAATAAIKLIQDLAINGRTDPTDPFSTDRKHYLTIEMTNAFNQLLVTLKSAGINVEGLLNGAASASITVNQLLNWRNLAVSSSVVVDTLKLALDASSTQNHSLQALVELIYVKTGNELLSNNLADLEKALQTTKDGLSLLTDLQNLHNNITVTTQKTILEAYPQGTENIANPTDPTKYLVSGDANNFASNIQRLATIHYSEISPAIQNNITSEDRGKFINLYGQLVKTITALEVTTPLVDGVPSEGTLLAKLNKVKDDIDKSFAASGVTNVLNSNSTNVAAAIEKWILDNQVVEPGTSIASAAQAITGLTKGQIQQDLTNAITAGQSLNDQQKDQVRQILFVFEEYYKSASAILSKITQMIERMAQAIAR